MNNITSNRPEGRSIISSEVPIWEKANLTLTEAAAYTGIGVKKLRQMTDEPTCNYVLWNGCKRLIKRKKLDEFIDHAFSV